MSASDVALLCTTLLTQLLTNAVKMNRLVQTETSYAENCMKSHKMLNFKHPLLFISLLGTSVVYTLFFLTWICVGILLISTFSVSQHHKLLKASEENEITEKDTFLKKLLIQLQKNDCNVLHGLLALLRIFKMTEKSFMASMRTIFLLQASQRTDFGLFSRHEARSVCLTRSVLLLLKIGNKLDLQAQKNATRTVLR